MFVLSRKYPVAVNVGKVDYNMVYRWKQLAMCADKKALEEYVKKAGRADEYKIEEYPN